MPETSVGGGALVPSVKADSDVTPPENPPPLPHQPPHSAEGGDGDDADFMCPICMQMIKDAFLTACGHSYCYMCIFTHLRNKSDCPSCSRFLTPSLIFPNFALDKLLKKMADRQVVQSASSTDQLRRALQKGCDMSLKDLDSLLSLLTERKRKMEQEEVETNLQILLEFLVYLRKKKLEELSEMQNDLKYIKEDIQVIQKRRIDLSNIKDRYNLRVRMVDDDLTMMDPPASMPVTNDCGTQGTMTSGSMSVCRDDPLRSQEIRETNAIACSGSQHLVPSEKVTARKRQIQAQFTDLQEYYLKRRRNWAKTSQAAPERDLNVTNSLGYHVGLEDLQTVLTSCTRYSQLRVVSELRCGDFFHPANIFSSIEFDRDNELFAIAGASRRIKVFEFSSVMDEPAEVHCAVVDIATRSKLSCLSWNKYSKNYIAGSDYEGIVNVWDVNTRQSVGEYEEHEKRAWSVDFSWTEPSLLVSGGDDCKVKVWSTKQEGSVLTINMNANICSVKCNPGSSVHVAVGSADRQVYYYRFRASDSEDTDDDRGQHFVSAVCWKSGSPIILAANSRGNINVLSLTT